MSAIPAHCQPRIGSLCSGYGGLDLATTDLLGGEVAWHAETDPHAHRVLAAHWPDAPNHGDITTADWSHVEPVDVITAGYPCQPESDAGQRRSTEDERWIWPAVADAVRALGPRLVLLENVRGHVGRGLSTVVGDLAGMGYDAVWGCVRASDAGAAHRRERVFIAAWPAADSERDARPGGDPHRAAAARRGPAATDADDRGPRWRGPGEQQGAATTTGCGGVATHTTGVGLDPRRTEGPGQQGRSDASRGGCVDWGDYAPAVARWERILGRPAPAATIPGRTGSPVLSPELVEWLMGLPAGWVTDVPGIPRTAALRLLGNGVVPQQAALAYRLLLT